MLDDLIQFPDNIRDDISSLVEQFKGVFPSSAAFSRAARESISSSLLVSDSDSAIIQLMDREYEMAKMVENQKIALKIKSGFLDAADYRKFSQSLAQSSKSRAGSALENHIAAVLRAHNIRFSEQVTTEGNNTPDFIFPSAAAYHDPSYSASKLAMAGAKRTVRDRWRQVPFEANRIAIKHLITIDTSLSVAQIHQMANQSVRLVIPHPLHSYYPAHVSGLLMTVREFIDYVGNL